MQTIMRIYQLILLSALIAPVSVLAATSANFHTNQERGGPTEMDSSSPNYHFKAEVGHPGVGTSTSPNYIYDHGTIWAEASAVTATIQWAVPQMRVGVAETNDETDFYISVYSAAEDGAPALFTMPNLETTLVDGTYLATIPLTGISAGTYDITFKGHQHIAKKLNDIALVAGNNVLNFSTLDNSAPKGAEVLLGGDISNAGTTPATLGDDVVNSVDISILLGELDNNDPTGNAIRANINQDTVVNSVDMSILLDNIDKTGESS